MGRGRPREVENPVPCTLYLPAALLEQIQRERGRRIAECARNVSLGEVLRELLVAGLEK